MLVTAFCIVVAFLIFYVVVFVTMWKETHSEPRNEKL